MVELWNPQNLKAIYCRAKLTTRSLYNLNNICTIEIVCFLKQMKKANVHVEIAFCSRKYMKKCVEILSWLQLS